MNKVLRMATNNPKDIVYPELSFEIVGACFDVHNELGRFAREKQYADLLENKIGERGFKYVRELRLGDSGNVVDFLLEDKVILELKAVPTLTRGYYRQIQNYLQWTRLELGLLVNFSDTYLQPKRVLRVTAPHSQSFVGTDDSNIRSPHS